MQTNHHPEHITFPATKMLPVEDSKFTSWSRPTKKAVKKYHARKSRNFLKKQLKNNAE